MVRHAGAAKNTVISLLERVGNACGQLHGEVVRNVPSRRFNATSCGLSSMRSSAIYRPGMRAHRVLATFGPGWLWMPDHKLVISWLVGLRNAEYASALMHDLRSRVAGRI